MCARNPKYKKIVKLTAKTKLRLFRRQPETDEVMQTVTRGTYACVYLISGAVGIFATAEEAGRGWVSLAGTGGGISGPGSI